MAWCITHRGLRRAAVRATVAALSVSFIELVGWKARMVEETSSIMPTSLSSSVA